jgi:hypothetical protein
VIENGVDAGGMQPIRERAERNELLFVGVLGYPPNSDAVLYFNREILPLIGSEIPDVHLTVVGRAAPDRVARLNGSGRVTVAGFVEDLLPYYRDAKIAVVPLGPVGNAAEDPGGDGAGASGGIHFGRLRGARGGAGTRSAGGGYAGGVRALRGSPVAG